ncbi:MAG TPA: hypothetical protein VLN26_12285 [Gaiellaceae bacterium]|nr:hypothetical protein [Gaiellaceae bacterium]
MRRAVVIAAVAASYVLLVGFMALFVVALTTALADGWKLRQAAERHLDSSPRFSPDGSLIAFLRGAELWVMAGDGADQRPVAGATRFAWTRRGDALLVSRGGSRVFLVGPEGGSLVPAGRAQLPRAARSDRHGGSVVFVRDHRLWLRARDGSVQELT